MAAARAAQVAVLVREGVLRTWGRVKHVGGLRHGSEEESCGRAPARHLYPHAWSKEIGQLLAREGEGIAGTVRQRRRAQKVIGAHDGRRGDGRGTVQQSTGSNSTWEASKAEAVLEARSFVDGRFSATGDSPALLSVVNEVAAGPIGAEANGMESAAKFRLILGVAGEASQLMDAMGKLALVSVFAGPVLLKGAAQLCLVAAGVDLSTRLLLLKQALTAFGEGAVPNAVLPGPKGWGWLPLEAVEEVALVELGIGQGDRMSPGETPASRSSHRFPVQQTPSNT